jgi:hypothetical protein
LRQAGVRDEALEGGRYSSDGERNKRHAGAGPGFSHATRHDDHSICRWWASRYHRPNCRRHFYAPPWPTVCGGKCRRRRRHDWSASRRARNKDFPANNLSEFVAYAKANAGKLNVGHAGVGSVSYIGCLLLNAAIGIKPTLIPFTGTAPVLNAMLVGEIDYECDPVLGTLAQVRAGSVRALAIAAKKRSPMLPDVPTSYEQGLPEFDCAVSYAAFAPIGTPKPIIEKLAEALNRGLNEESVQKRLADLGADIVESGRRGPKPLADLVRSESARLIPILNAATDK